jgi:hypothetical protein
LQFTHATTVKRLATSLGPPGDEETQRRREKARIAHEYSERVREVTRARQAATFHRQRSFTS